MKPAEFLNSSTKDFTFNLNNDYRYLKTGYYVSMHAEVLGNSVIPTTQNLIDANRTPILLLKASKAGIPTLSHVATGSVKQIISQIGFPVVLFAINPFSYDGFKTAKNRSALYRAVKCLSLSYKFAVCAQPLRGEMVSFKSIFGECESKQSVVEDISQRVYEIFKIPICKLHVQIVGNEAYLCGLQPLGKEEMYPSDLEKVAAAISGLSEKGEHLVG